MLAFKVDCFVLQAYKMNKVVNNFASKQIKNKHTLNYPIIILNYSFLLNYLILFLIRYSLL